MVHRYGVVLYRSLGVPILGILRVPTRGEKVEVERLVVGGVGQI